MTAKINMGVFPSGQWGQTVNLLLSASVVRIHPRPPRTPVSEPGTGVSVLSVLQKGLQGWIRTASTRRIVRRVKKPLRGFFRCAACAIHPRPPRTPVSEPGTGVSVLSVLQKGLQGWIRTASTRRIVRRGKAPVQQRRPLPAAETGRSCWGCGQQDARAAQGTMQPLGAATRAPYTARLATSARTHIASVPDL